MIIASVCTIPERKNSFQRVLQRIVFKQTLPVHELHVHLNGYQEQPSDFVDDDRVRYHYHPDNPGPWIRYRSVERVTGGDIFLTLDDDLAYPADYIEVCVRHAINNPISPVVTFGGITWDPCVNEFQYGENRFHYSYTDGLSEFRKVAVLMGGVSVFQGDAAANLRGVLFTGYEFNDDLLCSYVLQQRKINILCAPKKVAWITEQKAAHMSHALYVRDSANRIARFADLVYNKSFDASAGLLGEFVMQPERILVGSTVCPPLEGSRELHERLMSLCAEGASVHVFAPVGSSRACLAQRHVDVPYVVHAVAVPEEGGRLDWVAPVRGWRGWRVRSVGEGRLRKRLSVVLKKLNPTRVEWFGSQPSSWWNSVIANASSLSLH